MFRKGTPELRATNVPSYHDVRDHFYVEGDLHVSIPQWGSTYNGMSMVVSLTGTVKILPLANGDWSLRSMGNKGNCQTVHALGDDKVVADGIVTTVESHYWWIQNNAE